MNSKKKKVPRLLVTGGASTNVALLQVVADVFGVPVFAADSTNAVALGGAYRAMHAYKHPDAKFDVSKIVKTVCF